MQVIRVRKLTIESFNTLTLLDKMSRYKRCVNPLGIESGKKKTKRKKRDTQVGSGTLGSRLVTEMSE